MAGWTRFATGVAAASLAASGCTFAKASDSACEPTRPDTSDIYVEGDAWSGYAPFRVASERDVGQYEMQYVEQVCQDMRADDLSEGRAQFILTTLDQYILQQPEGSVVGVIDQSLGADALVLNSQAYPYLQSVDDLERLIAELGADGRKPVLAYTGSSPSEMLLNELANTTEELHPDDFELVSVDESAAALEMLDSGEAELAILWEPDTSAAVASGYEVALSSADVPDSIVDVIVASDDVIEESPQIVRHVVEEFYTAMDDYLADPERLEDLIAEDGGLSNADAGSVIEGVKLYGTADAHEFMNTPLFPLDQPQLTQSLESIGSVLALIHPEIDVDKARVDGSFVKELYEQQGGADG